MSDDTNHPISWTPLLEQYFASVAERSHCYSWLHTKAEAHTSLRKTALSIPVIVLSGVIGFLSVGSTALFEGNEKTASVSLGMMSLFVSILQTVENYFTFAKRAEGHRIGALSYAKLYRTLVVEMGLPQEQRMHPNNLLKYCKNETDRLAETCPSLPNNVLAEFRSRFSDKKYDQISKPPEANGLEHVEVFSVAIQNPKLSRTPLPESSLPFQPVVKKSSYAGFAGLIKSSVPDREQVQSVADGILVNKVVVENSSHAQGSQSNSLTICIPGEMEQIQSPKSVVHE
jgi:hypothetical protein